MSIGEALAQARGQAGLTVAEVSQRTRIRATVITGIESDDYSACGGDFYARGSIRSVAKAVGADPEPLICEYDAVHRAPGVLSAVSLDELVPPVQASARRWLNWTTALGLALALALGFAAYRFLAGSQHVASTPPAAANHVTTDRHGGRSGTPTALTGASAALRGHPVAVHPARPLAGPAATVRAYVTAINGHHYARAWRLGGRNAGGSYSQFVSGFGTTARDTVTIVSVSGDVVTGRITAQQTDGAVDVYQGTYTVDNGVIVGFDVLPAG
ncbi:MAG TPA: helix-turn-helix transcriptional regulator [Streptosporangiaceae bacterium]|nr:helix-turn-helix transcriptional regulator [Streptosporangiaceae bacterium]